MTAVVEHAPRFLPDEAEGLARSLFELDARANALPSWSDQNFRLEAIDGTEWVLKISNATENEAVLDLQNRGLEHLGSRCSSVAVPCVRPSISGELMATVRGVGDQRHFVRLLSWVPGVALAEVTPHSRSLLGSLGQCLADVDVALADFSHPAMDRSLEWDLKHSLDVRRYVEWIADASRRATVEAALQRFEERVVPELPNLRRSVIHGDWNDYNVLVSPATTADRRVVGVIDFGDVVYSATVFDLAIALAYAMLDKDDPVTAGVHVVRRYHEVLPLSELEVSLLFDLICARLCQSVALSAHQLAVAPENTYLKISQQVVCALLDHLTALEPEWVHCAFRHACSLPPCPRTEGVVRWLEQNADDFGPVVAGDLRSGDLVVFDLSPGSLEIPDLDEVEDTAAFTARLFGRMEREGVTVGVGRYDEPRIWYTSDLFAGAGSGGPESRTVHLGVDLFVEAGSPVYAPLDGRVHSWANNAGPGDYGPTIVLQHAIGDDDGAFHTLYGHLSVESLDGLASGAAVRRGDRLGWLGDAEVNGGWPPHLHFQLIVDRLGQSGNYPGVAAPSEREIWLSLSPDPNLLLGIPESRSSLPSSRSEEVLARRRVHLGPSLSLSYDEPLHLVRGHRQFLFDEDGRRFLDAVNNVAHVGHSHPRVVEAAASQMAVLNTNSRYLHDNLVRYAERLAALLPDPLEVCFLVNSGSEANDLALRLAGAHTGRRGLVVVDGAYHGNLSSVVEISPYKCDGPGGAGLARHARKVRTPDLYRGPYSHDDPTAGAGYAGDVEASVAELASSELRVAAFLAESLMSCAGQIVLPAGYLDAAYGIVREAGGLCIADEVQVGFGRVGSHLWGFETQSVVPDIVTLGKPIGNGFPLAAVVTSRAISESFDNGMEYFNTYGGGPVAAAVGLAVLDVMHDEQLQEQARRVGGHLLAALREVGESHPLVGDVRGLGLFLGIELVRDRQTLEPAADEARYIVNRMKDLGVLMSTDGPFHNVLKIKPPMVFDERDADRLVNGFTEVLRDDYLQSRQAESDRSE